MIFEVIILHGARIFTHIYLTKSPSFEGRYKIYHDGHGSHMGYIAQFFCDFGMILAKPRWFEREYLRSTSQKPAGHTFTTVAGVRSFLGAVTAVGDGLVEYYLSFETSVL